MASNIEIKIGAVDTASQVIAKVSANVAKFAAATGESMKQIGKSVSSIGAGITGVGASITGPLAAAVVSFGQAGTELAKLSVRTGVGVEALSELRFAAEQSGVEFDDLGGAMEELNIRLGEAVIDGTGPAVAALANLGLSAEQLANMETPERLEVLADAISKIGSNTQKQFLADEIFGGDAFRMMTLLDRGAEGIRELRHEARELGVSLSSDEVNSAKQFNAAWNTVKTTLSGVKNQIGAALAPALTAIVIRVSGIISGIVKWIRDNQQLVQILAVVGTAITVLGASLVTIGGTLFATGVAFTGLGTAATVAGTVIAAAFSPIGAIIAAVVIPVGILSGLFLVAAQRVGLLSKGVEAVGKLLTVLAGVAKQTFAGISQAIQDGNWGLAIEIAMAGAKVAFYAGLESIYQSFLEIFPLMWDAAKEFFRMFADLAFKTMTTVAKAVAKGGLSGAGMLANLLDSALFADGPSLGSGGSEFLAEKKRLAQADLDRLTKPATSGIGQGITPKDGVGAGGTGTQLKEQVDIAKKMLDELKKITDASQKPVGDGTVLAIQVGP